MLTAPQQIALVKTVERCVERGETYWFWAALFADLWPVRLESLCAYEARVKQKLKHACFSYSFLLLPPIGKNDMGGSEEPLNMERESGEHDVGKIATGSLNCKPVSVLYENARF